MKKIIILMFCIVLLIGNVSSFTWDNVKNYDSQSKTVTVVNAFGFGEDIADVKLQTPLNNLVPRGYGKVAQFEVTSYGDYLDSINQLELFNNKDGGRSIIRNYDYKVSSYINESVYETTCSQRLYGNGSMEKYDCKQTQIGIRQREIWTKLNKIDFSENEVVTIGIFTDVQKGDIIEWIPNLFGVRVQEWATWTASLNADLVAYYAFEGGNVSNILDSTDFSNNGTGQNMEDGDFVNGVIGNALRCNIDTGDEFINISNAPQLNIGKNAAWAYWANFTNNDGDDSIFGKYDSFAPGSGYGQVGSGTNMATFMSTAGGSVNFQLAHFNNFTHYVFTRNQTAVEIYINGVLNITANRGANITSDDADLLICGASPGNVGFANVTFDELAIWNRSISASEAIDLYNGGAGISFLNQGTEVNLDIPLNDTTQITPEITFNCSAGTGSTLGIRNLSLFIDNIINTTVFNTTLIQNLSLQTNLSIPNGNHNWTCNAFTRTNSELTTETRIFTVSDFTENSQTFNNITTEGATETFSINITLRNSLRLETMNLIYNGTTFSSPFTLNGNEIIATRELVIPVQDANVNVSFHWEINTDDGTTRNSTFNNQTINIINLDDCGSFSNLIYNYTLKDEESQTKITNITTMEIQLSLFDQGKTTEIVNFSQNYTDVNPAQVCLNVNLTNENYTVDSVVKYFANITQTTNYAIEYHNLLSDVINNATIPRNIDLLNLKSADSTDFQLTFRDEFLALAPNIRVLLFRQYVVDNDFKIVEIPLTDSNGQTILHMVRNDIVYNLVMIDANRNIIATFNQIIAFCNDFTIGQCTINLNTDSPEDTIFNFTGDVGVTFTQPVFSNITNLVTTDFTSINLTAITAKMEVIRNNQFGNRSVCIDTLTSVTGTLSCNVSNIVTTDKFLFVNLFVNDKLKIMQTINLEGDDFGFGIVTGSFYAFLFILLLITMFMEDKQVLIISLVIGWAAIVAMGLIKGTLFGAVSGGVWLIISAIIFLWKLKKEEES